MNLQELAKTILPNRAFASLRHAKWERERRRVAALPPLTEKDFREILRSDLNLSDGDLVYIHSGMDGLNLDFPFYRIRRISDLPQSPHLFLRMVEAGKCFRHSSHFVLHRNSD